MLNVGWGSEVDAQAPSEERNVMCQVLRDAWNRELELRRNGFGAFEISSGIAIEVRYTDFMLLQLSRSHDATETKPKQSV